MKFNPLQKINVLATTGALGDTCATFPTLKILVERGHVEKLFVDDRYIGLYRLFFPNNILVNLKDAMTVIPAHEVTPDVPRDVIDPATGEARFLDYPINSNIPMVRTMQPFPTSIHSELVDCFSLALCDTILKPEQKNYPKVNPAKLPLNPLKDRDYVVIAYGATTEHRRMLPEVLVELVDHFKTQHVEAVLLGKRDHELSCSGVRTKPTFDAFPDGVVDLIDQTTIPEALAIIQDAQIVIGLDNGLIHLAALTDVPIVAGYTTVDPFYRLPYRHGEKGWGCFVVKPTSECKYCQTDTFATYGINFLRCNTRTKECMYSLSPSHWLAQIGLAYSKYR